MLSKQELGQSRSGKRGSSPEAEAQRWGRRLERLAGPTVLRVLDRTLGQDLGVETSEEAAQGSWGEKWYESKPEEGGFWGLIVPS